MPSRRRRVAVMLPRVAVAGDVRESRVGGARDDGERVRSRADARQHGGAAAGAAPHDRLLPAGQWSAGQITRAPPPPPPPPTPRRTGVTDTTAGSSLDTPATTGTNFFIQQITMIMENHRCRYKVFFFFLY